MTMMATFVAGIVTIDIATGMRIAEGNLDPGRRTGPEIDMHMRHECEQIGEHQHHDDTVPLDARQASADDVVQIVHVRVPIR